MLFKSSDLIFQNRLLEKICANNPKLYTVYLEQHFLLLISADL